MNKRINEFTTCVLNSYSQVFFSDNKTFAVILLIVSFADIYAGISGLLAVLVTNATAILTGFDRRVIQKGLYGFNSLLVGLCLGITFSPGLILFSVVILASLLTLFISVTMQGVIGKYGLPYLSIPFLLGAWVVTMATKDMSFLGLSERGIFTINELYLMGGHPMVRIYEWWNNVEIFRPLRIYFLSLGAILFQYNVLAGILIATGLLLHSRISFTLSLLGFFAAYFFYGFTGADISELNYSYIGFNYVLTAIAAGGFFIIPSWRSYLWSVMLVPVTALLTLGLYNIFSQLGLPLFALPFNIIVLIYLYSLKFRIRYTPGLSEVIYQQNTPEKNLYAFENDISRVRYDKIALHLPFHGTWSVAQGYDGEHTHTGEWRYALDFVIVDHNGSQFMGKGDKPEDYLCFGKPVTAPADGIVESVTDNIPDNQIGSVNLRENWGNSVIIRHSNSLYSSLNHLRKDSVTVRPGEKVKAGDIVGKCGNSGRSPYPHLHFQLQEQPFTGSPTIHFPVSYFIEHSNRQFNLRNYSVPLKGALISNIDRNSLLMEGFNLIPGMIIKAESVDSVGVKTVERWEVRTNEYNSTYIACCDHEAKAWFTNDGSMFMFRHYDGSRSTLLYYFFLAAFRVQFGFYPEMTITDNLPLNLSLKRRQLLLQDFVAPFFKFIRSEYSVRYDHIDNALVPGEIKLVSASSNYIFGKLVRELTVTTVITNEGITGLFINDGAKNFEIKLWVEERL